MAYDFEDQAAGIFKRELGPFGTNAYIVVCKSSGESVIIDAPGNPDQILVKLAGTRPKCIVITHSHIDHIGALEELKSALRIPVAIHPLDADKLPCPPDIELNDGDLLDAGSLKIKVLHTPGHTPGSLCLLAGKYLLSGDTIFPGGPGHTMTAADFKTIVDSIVTRVLVLPDDTRICPGHGDNTTLAAEKKSYAIFNSRPHAEDLHGDVLWLSS